MRGTLREQLQPIRDTLGPKRFWCDGKQRHVSLGAAEAHARSLRRRYGASCQAYKCPSCLGYHVGRTRERVS